MRVIETRNNTEEIKQIRNTVSFRTQLTVFAICSHTNTHVVHTNMHTLQEFYFTNSTSVVSFIVCPEIFAKFINIVVFTQTLKLLEVEITRFEYFY